MKPIIHVSNDFQVLKKQLQQQLFFTPSKPFERKYVFLPDLKEKNRLQLSFLREVDVMMGIDFLELGSGLQFLYKALTGKTLHFPPLDLLTLHLLPLIESCPELKAYTGKKRENLALALSKEFLRYGKFGHVQIEGWKQKKGWQQTLWKEVFSKWDLPAQLLETPFVPPDEPLEIHLYKFSFLPEITHRFFEKVAEHCPVHYYQFSPCSVFWTDIFSEKERFQAEKKADPQVRDEWAAYLRDRPYLLANFGRLSRQTFRLFEEADFILDEVYQPSEPSTLLNRIKNHILHFQTPPKQDIPRDHSLILHPASSKRREVEILYTTLLRLKDFRPSDVRIYAPDISAYAPFISFIFGAESSPFAFSISDLPKEQESSFLRAFLTLLSLNQNRFKREAVLDLFACPSFISPDEKSFTEWMEKGGVKWGVDRAHREILLSGEPLHEEGETGTWEHAFGCTLEYFAKIPQERSIWELPILDFSDAEMFGRGVALLRSLKNDLVAFETTSLTLSQWSHQLRSLLTRYFQVEEEETYALQWLEEKLTLLESDALPQTPFPFQPIFRYLKNALGEKGGKQDASEIEALQFASLKLGAPDYASVICLLGLDENQFPRLTTKSSLSEIQVKEEPTAAEEDRQLFLETLFAPSSQLILSYVNINEEDGKEQAPSPLIQELLAYLDTVYTIEGQSPSEVIPKHHPPFLFHENYFQESPIGPFAIAQQFYSPQTTPTPFIPEFLNPEPLPSPLPENLSVDLSHLSRFAKHPLRFYLNHTLNLYLDYENRDEEFTLSPLNQLLLRRLAHHTTFEKAFEEANRQGKLPLGRFKEVTRCAAEEEMLDVEKPFSLEVLFDIPLEGNRVATLQGTLVDLTPEGMLFHGENKLPDLLKIWPLFLTFACQDHPAKKQLLLTKTGECVAFPKLNPQKALSAYLLYYEKALATPSPFLPNWAQSFLEKDPPHLAKRIEATTDPYVTWVFKPQHYSPKVLFDTWSPLLKETFKELHETV